MFICHVYFPGKLSLERVERRNRLRKTVVISNHNNIYYTFALFTHMGQDKYYTMCVAELAIILFSYRCDLIVKSKTSRLISLKLN